MGLYDIGMNGLITRFATATVTLSRGPDLINPASSSGAAYRCAASLLEDGT
jgi:hypothetical protein